MLFILHLHKTKYHERELAKEELKSLFYDIKPRIPDYGPLQDQKGIMWLEVFEDYVKAVEGRAKRLGYFQKVDALLPYDSGNIKYKNQNYMLQNIFTRTKSELEDSSANKRKFLLETSTGLKEVVGFRGDTDPTGPKALPVIESKLLTNLCFIKKGSNFLDPFAGIGGIVIEAINAGYEVSSSDISSKVSEGIKSLGSNHVVADCSNLPFENSYFDSIATEFPFSNTTLSSVSNWLKEMLRVTKPQSKIVIMCSKKEAKIIRENVSKDKITLDMETKRGGKKVQIIRIEK